MVSFVESSVDGDHEIPALGFLSKLYIRRYLFAACVLVPTVVSLLATALTPAVWVARTEIMIRYGANESSFLQNLIPDNRASLSGPVIGELVRSLPTLTEAVRRYDIKPDDVYAEPRVAVMRRLAKLVPFHTGNAAGADPDAEVLAVARALQSSLEESSKAGANALSAKARPVEILGTDSALPQSAKGDELITLTLRSFNRDKVAAMTNGLAETVIDTYYRISAEDAHRSYLFLSGLVDEGEAALKRLAADPSTALAVLPGGTLDSGGNDTAVRSSPAIAKLNGELAAAQAELARTQQYFGTDSDRVQRVTAEVADLKQLIVQQERLETAKATLAEIKTRRFQALNTENLYRKKLVPISIVEPAVTPDASGAGQVVRFAVSGGVGLVVGTILGAALVIIFGLLDQRLFTPADVERAVGLPTIGWLPRLKAWQPKSGFLPHIDDHALWNAETGLLQTLSHFDLAKSGEHSSVVAIASPSDEEGKSFVALLLAKTLARPGRCKVLLIDADPVRASLSNHFRHLGSTAAAAQALQIGSLSELVIQSGVPNLDLLPAELMQEHENVGFYLSRVRGLFASARQDYDLVVVDTPSISAGGEALICSMAADSVLFVVRSGSTRSLMVKAFLRKLHEVAVKPQGVILNCRYACLPPFFDRGV